MDKNKQKKLLSKWVNVAQLIEGKDKNTYLVLKPTNELPDVTPMNKPIELDYSIYPKPFRKLWERWYNEYIDNRTLCLDCPDLMTSEQFEKYAGDCYQKFCMDMYNSKQSGLILKDFMREVFKNQEFSDKWMKI
jgi:hypothetical protein